MQNVYFETPLGTALLTGDETGIFSFSLLDEKFPTSTDIPDYLEKAVIQIGEYFSGNRKNFDLNLNPNGTDFQKKVWQLLGEIPFGETISYQQLSKNFGDPKAIRAIASANGKNPLWILVPCHRVIGSNGSLVGYAGGIWRKKYLLELENPNQQKLF
ncbi:methylated-DNA--[protein]-cysteine S-methyltransferase [Flavobacterium sp. NST-5]|uniref:Methylated-DNA--protein-cysteine methyltransferase n=1 Tax=Flavobacterium ichthyis TaxID=2698827 RepID=A0ABW9Z859_9FLAO|nr:methylated-DNA--[protein]-cysteine S-methyltransferase [Flavobacterium ichthyis]NBL65043.1 methylated-DNA--[protein]-cysteine S-methyltransferase [Flavobacterium ichthyis]